MLKKKRQDSNQGNKKLIFSNKFRKKTAIAFIICGSILLALTLSYGWYSVVYADKIFPNVEIGQLDFSGLNREQAQELIKEKIKEDSKKEIKFVLQDKNWTLELNELNLKYLLDETIEKLYRAGRTDNFWNNFKQRVKLLVRKENVDSIYDYESTQFNKFLSDIFEQCESKVVDSYFTYENNEIKILPEKSGEEINKGKIYTDFNNTLANLEFQARIDLQLQKTQPKITSEQLKKMQSKFSKVLADDITLESEIKNITINKSTIANWLDLIAININSKFSKSTNLIPKAFANKDLKFEPHIEINQEKVRQFIAGISTDINQDTKDAKLSFSDGKVSVFQAPETGYKLDQDETVKKITNLLYSRLNIAGINTEDKNNQAVNNKISMVLKITEPDVNDKNIDRLGIKDLLASGSTSFYGSPSNRIFNIQHGAQLFNGVVVKPGETLSAISVLGNPSAETGYLPELVIKENKTIPEYGGGLCQISTTLFRAALNSGLEIIERLNHMYRVSYYEPPIGMDATVYYPKPDLIIKNNTPAHILIQTNIVGSKITFSFYGTKDGRVVEISEPTTYDHINPPETKYIDSNDLEPGQTKRLESAHPGVKAQFNYKVIINNKTVIDTVFKSIYKAWQAIYLRGPNEESKDEEEHKEEEQNEDPQPTPTPTPTPIPTPTSSPPPTPSLSTT